MKKLMTGALSLLGISAVYSYRDRNTEADRIKRQDAQIAQLLSEGKRYEAVRYILNNLNVDRRVSKLPETGVWFGEGVTYDTGYFSRTPAWVMFKNNTPYTITVKIEGAIPGGDFDAQPKLLPSGKLLLNGIGLWHLTDVVCTTDAVDVNGSPIVPAIGRRNLALAAGEVLYAAIDTEHDPITGLTKLVLRDTRGL